MAGVGHKPEGANYYPQGMTKAEFDAAVAAGGPRADSLKSLYTLVRRDASGRLYSVPFHVAYARFTASSIGRPAAPTVAHRQDRSQPYPLGIRQITTLTPPHDGANDVDSMALRDRPDSS